MSLFLLGSCSKITSAIVKCLATENLYRRIIIGDPLPSYSFFKRFYNLKGELSRVDTKTVVDILKITTLEAVNENIADASDVLFITHDYAKNIISKTELVKQVAEDAKHSQGKTILYVAPAEYDNYFFNDPYREYLNGETVLKRKLPSVNIIRTDMIENGEYHQYFADNLTNTTTYKMLPEMRSIKLVRQKTLFDEIVRILTKKPTGESILLRGDTPLAETPVTQRSENVLDPIEKLFDTWGMKSNLKELSRIRQSDLHTLFTGRYNPEAK